MRNLLLLSGIRVYICQGVTGKNKGQNNTTPILSAHFTATDIFDAMNWINWIETLGTQRNPDMCLNLDT